jgi:hypothetical protein
MVALLGALLYYTQGTHRIRTSNIRAVEAADL